MDSDLSYLMGLVGESNKLIKREHHAGNDGNVVGDGSSGLTITPEESDTTPAQTKPSSGIDYSHPIAQKIADKAAEYNLGDPTWMIRHATHESGLNPNRVNDTVGSNGKASNATGVFQFIPSTWSKVGQGQDPKNADANIDAFMRTVQSTGKFFDANGIEKTPTNYRLAQYFGPEGAKNVLSNPDAPLTKTLPAYVFPTNPNLLKQTGNDAISEADAITSGKNFQMPPRPSADVGSSSKSSGSSDGKSKDWTDTLTSEKFLVPLFSGLAGMASSPSRYFGSAILQGLGAGAQSYQQMKAQESVMNKREADIQREKEQSQIGLGTLGVQQQTAQTARISKVAEIMQQLRTLNAGREIAGLPALDTAEFFKSIGAGDLLKDAPLPADTGAGKTAGTTTQQPAGGTQQPVAGQPGQQPPAGGAPAGTSTDKTKQLETTVANASQGMPKPTDDFWKGVDPNDNLPLLQKNFKIAMGSGLTPLAEKIANDINRVKTSGQVMKNDQVVAIPGFAETEAAKKAMVTKAEKETAEPFETKKMSTEKNFATQNTARSKAAVEADNANDLLSQTSAMKSLLFDKDGKPLVNTGPLGEKINRYAGMFKQAGFSDNFIKQLMNTDPNNADAVKKLQTSTGTELARMELNGAPVRVGEFNQYVQNATPGAQMLPGAIKWIIDNAIEPKAKAQQAVYERVMDMDPAKDNIEKEIYLARKENPWHHYTPTPQEATKPPPAPDVAAAELARRRAAKGTQ